MTLELIRSLLPIFLHCLDGSWRVAMASSSSFKPSCRDVDNTMHAWAGSCRGGLDFTLLFEETILEILPISLIIMIIPLRIWQLSQKRPKVVSSYLLPFKLVSAKNLSYIN